MVLMYLDVQVMLRLVDTLLVKSVPIRLSFIHVVNINSQHQDNMVCRAF
jgi:hypothetical protein